MQSVGAVASLSQVDRMIACNAVAWYMPESILGLVVTLLFALATLSLISIAFCACTFSNLDGFLCNAMIQLHPPRVPDTLKHVGQTESFSNEYPSQVYAFNWCLNGDGMTPLRKSAFCITKPLDLKIVGLPVPITNPLKVRGTHTVKNYFWCWCWWKILFEYMFLGFIHKYFACRWKWLRQLQCLRLVQKISPLNNLTKSVRRSQRKFCWFCNQGNWSPGGGQGWRQGMGDWIWTGAGHGSKVRGIGGGDW